MLVKVSKIEANPHRDLINYPIAHSKIEEKKASINKTGFWDNVLARPHPKKEGYFQLAYGHTRIEAIRELGIKEIELIIKDKTDMEMLLILADENKENEEEPSRVNETVYAVRKYINLQFEKCEKWEDLAEDITSRLFLKDLSTPTDKHHTKEGNKKIKFSNIKTKGPGAGTIYDFLGHDWSKSMISESLATLNASEKTDLEEGAIDIKAIESFPNNNQAVAFRQGVKTYGIKRPEQKALADKIIKNGSKSEKEIKKAIQEEVVQKKKSTALTKTDKHKIERDAELEELKDLIEETAKSVNSTNSKITRLLSKLNEMKVSTLSGLEITENDIYCGILVDTLIEFSPYLSFNISKEDK
jgi:Predicted transcriptional regulators